VKAVDFVRRLPEGAEPPYWHHIGIYAYRRAALERFVSLPPSVREQERRLEQMRALDAGMTIAITRVDTVPLGVDTPADLERARILIASQDA
jgi:3-deoxy-manno-octulosonate cytidylyltransferase (CMP-KDO synthetase)